MTDHTLTQIGPDLGRWTCSCGATGVAPFTGAIQAQQDHADQEAMAARLRAAETYAAERAAIESNREQP